MKQLKTIINVTRCLIFSLLFFSTSNVLCQKYNITTIEETIPWDKNKEELIMICLKPEIYSFEIQDYCWINSLSCNMYCPEYSALGQYGEDRAYLNIDGNIYNLYVSPDRRNDSRVEHLKYTAFNFKNSPAVDFYSFVKCDGDCNETAKIAELPLAKSSGTVTNYSSFKVDQEFNIIPKNNGVQEINSIFSKFQNLSRLEYSSSKFKFYIWQSNTSSKYYEYFFNEDKYFKFYYLTDGIGIVVIKIQKHSNEIKIYQMLDLSKPLKISNSNLIVGFRSFEELEPYLQLIPDINCSKP